SVLIFRSFCVLCCFFFQAEDGIRDRNVTGVQTCALPILLAGGTPISNRWKRSRDGSILNSFFLPFLFALTGVSSSSTETSPPGRSEERRVGKECRAR